VEKIRQDGGGQHLVGGEGKHVVETETNGFKGLDREATICGGDRALENGVVEEGNPKSAKVGPKKKQDQSGGEALNGQEEKQQRELGSKRRE